MSKSRSLLIGSLFAACVGVGCSAAPQEGASQSRSSAVSSECQIGGGQCLAGVQRFFGRFGITVGIAGSGKTDADGRWCADEGACLIWIDDVPSRYGWVRTSSPAPNDIAIFPPHPGNPWGHSTIVEHVDGAGVWMIDTNDNNDEVANNTPHLHGAAPYGYYHYLSPPASLQSCGSGGGGGGGDDPGGGSCAGLRNGLYCGNDYVHGDPNTLYRCSGGRISVEQTCSSCRSNPDGTNDECVEAPDPAPVPAPPPERTGSCAGYYDGLYCGDDYVNGDPDTLYRCSGGSISVEETCANGCRTNPDGTNDWCQ